MGRKVERRLAETKVCGYEPLVVAVFSFCTLLRIHELNLITMHVSSSYLRLIELNGPCDDVVFIEQESRSPGDLVDLSFIDLTC